MRALACGSESGFLVLHRVGRQISGFPGHRWWRLAAALGLGLAAPALADPGEPGGGTRFLALLEIPIIFVTVGFAAYISILLSRENTVLNRRQVARGMAWIAGGFFLLGVAHLILQSRELFGVDPLGGMFGESGGQFAWYLVILATWGLSLYGFVVILRATVQKRIDSTTAGLRQQAHTAERKAVLDPLTGAYNRLGMELVREHHDSNRLTDRPVSLLVFDLDNFKEVNDTWGHNAGDEVLRGVVRCALEVTRDHDIIVRLGGDEFCVGLPGTPLSSALTTGERLRNAIENMRTEIGEETIFITASIGVVEWEFEISLEYALQAADKALYAAKESGRNLVMMAGKLSGD